MKFSELEAIMAFETYQKLLKQLVRADSRTLMGMTSLAETEFGVESEVRIDADTHPALARLFARALGAEVQPWEVWCVCYYGDEAKWHLRSSHYRRDFFAAWTLTGTRGFGLGYGLGRGPNLGPLPCGDAGFTDVLGLLLKALAPAIAAL